LWDSGFGMPISDEQLVENKLLATGHRVNWQSCSNSNTVHCCKAASDWIAICQESPHWCN
jgi:hypothetical protein